MVIPSTEMTGITPANVPVTNTSPAVWTSLRMKFFSNTGTSYSLHNQMMLPRVTPLRQYSPVDVQTWPSRTIKKLVELQVDTNPWVSSIKPSSTPSLSASIQAAIQLCLLKELIRGSWVRLSRRVLTVARVIPFSFTVSLAFLYSGIITTVGLPMVTLGCW